MTAFHKYPEIVGLEKRPEILAVKEVVATEKLHGTNFRVFFPEGMTSVDDVQYGGRNDVFTPEQGQDFYGGRPMGWFAERKALLEKAWAFFQERGYYNVTLYGEIAGPKVQKGVQYTTGKEVIFRAFDIRIGANLVTYDLFLEICDAIGLPHVPEVWRGEPRQEAFERLLEQPSHEGKSGGISAEDNLMEGVVIRSNPLLRNVYGEWLIIKHKSAKFAEVAKAKIRQDQKDLTPVQTFARTYVLRGRVINALGRLRDANVPLVDGMEDMRHLAPAVIEDLHKECEPEWQVLIAQDFSDKQIRSAVSKTLAGVYQRMLREQVAET